jgi:hypothetical protein
MMTQGTKTKRKLLSKGQRAHVRRLKQEARRAGTVYRSPFGAARAPAVPKKDTEESQVQRVPPAP